MKDGNEHSNGAWPGPYGKKNSMAPSVRCSQLESLSNFSQEKRPQDLFKPLSNYYAVQLGRLRFVFLGRRINNRIFSC